jgi:hypothetical protein
MEQSPVRDERKESQGGLSLKLLASFVAFVAGRELFQFYTESSGWIASLVGLALWMIVMCIVPPRPRPWKLLLGTALLATLVVLLHLLHFG